MHFGSEIQSEAELRELFGTPSVRAQQKVVQTIDGHIRQFLQQSPFLLLATSDAEGRCDVSPRGDGPGFVHVLDEHHLLIPERPGNKRFDSLRNILANPQVGLLFLLPGLGETLRINGQATLVRDEALLREMAVGDRLPLLAIAVRVEEAFLHCAKALLRSHLWHPDTWPVRESLPSAACILADHANMGDSPEAIQESLQDAYRNRLY